MQSLLNLFVTPALVSLLVSMWAGRVMEAKRARRDHLTKLFEAARDDVRRGVESAVDYFATPPRARSALQEAKVLSSEREIRAGTSLLISEVSALGCELEAKEANQALTSLVAELTGGNFQSSEGDVDKGHLLHLVHAGAQMRTALARLRDDQLHALADNDPVVRRLEQAWSYARTNNPFRTEEAPAAQPTQSEREEDAPVGGADEPH